MGVLPLQFKDGENAKTLGFDGSETFDIIGLQDGASKTATVTATNADGSKTSLQDHVMLLPPTAVDHLRHGGLLDYVLAPLAAPKAACRHPPLGCEPRPPPHRRLWGA